MLTFLEKIRCHQIRLWHSSIAQVTEWLCGISEERNEQEQCVIYCFLSATTRKVQYKDNLP